MSDADVDALLQRLASGEPTAAWREFLARYSPLLRRIARRYALDRDLESECYEHVCAVLSDDRFRRLLAFRPDGKARFDTWLGAVAVNACVDWRRRADGRPRPPACVSALPELDRAVFHCVYERGMSSQDCLEALLPRFAGLNRQDVAAANGRVYRLFTPRQRWQLGARFVSRHPAVARDGRDESQHSTPRDPDPDPSPEEQVAAQQDQARLRRALARLPPDERLLVRLRYEQELTLAEVARLTGETDPFRANRRIHSALERLAALMADDSGAGERKT
jgi:RNA polymerase sigma factor (sigma-70 family)